MLYFSIFSFKFNNCTLFSLWHNRLGHLPLEKIRRLQLLNSSPDTNSVIFCDICLQAMQHKSPYPHSQIHIATSFELIHVDTWWPYHTPTQEGNKYFITIVDDYFSRPTWTFFLTTIRDVALVLKNFVQILETQFQIRIKVIRTDNNAFELGSSLELRTFFAEKGLSIKQPIFIHLNKMVWLRENIKIY